MLKAKPEMSPLQNGPVIFTTRDLMLCPWALADTSSSYWCGFLWQSCAIGEQRTGAVKFWDATATKHAGF